MKLHHAAALALVTWFIIMPPPMPCGPHDEPICHLTGGGKPGTTAQCAKPGAPLSEWHRIGSSNFNSAAACAAYLATANLTYRNETLLFGDSPGFVLNCDNQAELRRLSVCISSDDQRLAK